MLNMLKKVLGTKNDRDLKTLKPFVVQINAFESKMKAMSDEDLKRPNGKIPLTPGRREYACLSYPGSFCNGARGIYSCFGSATL